MSAAEWRLAVDIGGTFTDVVLVGGAGGRVITAKELTTEDPLGGVRQAVERALSQAGLDGPELVQPLVHATTLVTNALIEGDAAPVAFVTTAGFEDVFEIRTEHRFDMYDIQIAFAPPPVPRERVFGIAERTLAGGERLTVPSESDIDALAQRISTSGAQAVGVGFLHSYATDANERLVADRLAAATGLPVCTSSDVAGLVREYPRFVTTAANAATVPILGPYLERLGAWMSERGIPASVLLMLSNGGAVGTGVASRYPIRAIESGPAAGALAGSWFARHQRRPRLLCFDMGGTTAKACLLEDAEPEQRTVFEYARQYRFIAGSGLPLSIPSVDLIEIGAGGGSIARRDDFGLLAVGPRSAGADPGPACYGRGGANPTVTDADLTLGYLSPDEFAGGGLSLDAAAAEAVLGDLGEAMGMSGDELAAGIHELANQSMAAAAGRYATERGIDLRGVPLLAFGGAGPVHACGVAELLEADEVIFPPLASVLSAFGCLVSPVRIDLAHTQLELLSGLGPDELDRGCEGMRGEAREMLSESGLDPERAAFRYGIDARYRGQANEVTVWLGEGERFPVSAEAALEAFRERYEEMYGMTIPDVPVEVVTWRIAASGPEPDLARPQSSLAAGAAPRGVRKARFGVHAERYETQVYAREDLGPGTLLDGPAIVHEPDTTILLRPGWVAEVAQDLSLVARRVSGPASTEHQEEAVSVG